jgi:hypothetical protein
MAVACWADATNIPGKNSMKASSIILSAAILAAMPGDAYQLDIVYDTKAHGFNTFETCIEYAAIKSVTVMLDEHSAKLGPPAGVDISSKRSAGRAALLPVCMLHLACREELALTENASARC